MATNIRITPILPDAAYTFAAQIELTGEYQMAVQSGADAATLVRIEGKGRETASFRLFVPITIAGGVGDLPIAPLAASGYKFGLISADAPGYMVIRLRLCKGDRVSCTTTILALDYMGDGWVEGWR